MRTPVPLALTWGRSQPPALVPARSGLGTVVWWVGGGLEILLMGLAVPAGILLVGLPIALAMQVVLAILARL